MSKIFIEYDTVEKSLDVSMNGKALQNVDGVNIYRAYYDLDGDNDENDDPDFHLSVCTVEKNVDDGHAVITRISAAESPEGKSSEAQDVPDMPGFKMTTAPRQRRVEKQIADFFGRK